MKLQLSLTLPLQKRKKQNRNTHTQLFTLASPRKIGLLRVKLCSRIHFGLVNYNGNLHKQLYLFNEQPPADVGGKDREEKMKRNRVTEKKKRERENPLLDTGWPCFSLSFERNIAHLGQECAYNMEGYELQWARGWPK